MYEYNICRNFLRIFAYIIRDTATATLPLTGDGEHLTGSSGRPREPRITLTVGTWMGGRGRENYA